MGSTSPHGFPYPELADVPNIPQDVQDLAVAVNDEVVRVDADVAALAAVTALFATGATVSSFANTSGTTTSSTYVESLTGGTPCSTTFVAPPSGKVMVHNSSWVDNSSTGRSFCSWIIRTGGTIGSGSTFLDGGDEKAVANLNVDDVAATRTTLVTGLTPGATYNIRQQFKTSAGTTGSFQWKELIVVPVWK